MQVLMDISCESPQYRKNSNNCTQDLEVGVAFAGKVWLVFVFILAQARAEGVSLRYGLTP